MPSNHKRYYKLNCQYENAQAFDNFFATNTFDNEKITFVAQRHRNHQTRSPISFQSFDQSSRFPVEAPSRPRSVNIAAQLTVNPASLHLPTHHNNVRSVADAPRGGGGGSAVLPLFKQSYPGLYVKGHAAENLLKYEPTRQVAHHHGPDFQPRNVASSSPQQNFGVNPFSSFN
ncbi:unnamed protein product [Orchesella dallaii]|uniref:Uncharacterized protein n=1 Tax=Orchesella dallaii TaxID=48710 RepID=A0ABP1QKA5_9HEXA